VSTIDAVEARVQSALRASAPPLSPAVVVTVWDDPGAKRSKATLARLAAVAAPGDLAVAVHSTDPSDASVAVVRALGLRLWCALPYDPVARELRTKGHAAAVALARRYAERCARHRPEVVELNGEALWKPDAKATADALSALARETIAVTREACAVPVAWTSFDHLRYHVLPWSAIYGADGCDLATPQVYAAPEDGIGGSSAARARLKGYAAQWAALVASGAVRADLAPGGAHHVAYGQIHHLSPAAVAMVLDSSDTSRAWALPTRCDDAGLRALEVLLTARRLHGRSAGAIRRAQAAHGLVVDGVAGPLTCKALGLP
jgi:hypothetical protein